LIQFETTSAVKLLQHSVLIYNSISPRKIMIYCQKVGRLQHIRAVPLLKVGRLESRPTEIGSDASAGNRSTPKIRVE